MTVRGGEKRSEETTREEIAIKDIYLGVCPSWDGTQPVEKRGVLSFYGKRVDSRAYRQDRPGGGKKKKRLRDNGKVKFHLSH